MSALHILILRSYQILRVPNLFPVYPQGLMCAPFFARSDRIRMTCPTVPLQRWDQNHPKIIGRCNLLIISLYWRTSQWHCFWNKTWIKWRSFWIIPWKDLGLGLLVDLGRETRTSTQSRRLVRRKDASWSLNWPSGANFPAQKQHMYFFLVPLWLLCAWFSLLLGEY